MALGACGGGGGTTTPTNGPAFNLVLYADPDTGNSPLTVSFFAIPSNGVAPYTYAWDFNGDGVTDSNAPNGFYTYTASGQAKLTVTDGAGSVVSTTRTITVLTGTTPPPSQGLDVRFTATPGFGTVPFNVQFTAYVTGGKEPYQYAWDFQNDGTFDNFTANPLYTYTQIGTKIADNQYLQFPVLKVTDSRGVTGTNLDDNNGDGNPDFRIAINALPPGGGMTVVANANPSTGQAPLTVEFTGSATGGSGNNQYKWDFGDTTSTSYAATSLATHTYLNPGTYLAHVTAKDATTGEEVVSQDVTVNATQQQQLGITITSDISTGQVPFVVNFSANPVNGKEPISYNWDIFTDLTPAAAAPTVEQPGTPPSLAAKAVVTPYSTQRKNPSIHFANTADSGGAFSYVARCVATDASGNTAVSNLVRIVANPNTTYPFYSAERPDVVGESFWDPSGSTSHPQFQAIAPQAWSPRANAAVASHMSGISFVFGGERLDENGNFQGLVSRGDAMYMFCPQPNGSGDPGGNFGDISLTSDSITEVQGYGAGPATQNVPIPGLAGNFVRLNDGGAPAFPGGNDSPPQGMGNPPGPIPTQRGYPPTIVGSAAAVFIHKPVESNPDGLYSGAGGPQPDAPGQGYGLGTMSPGIGTPIIYVLGGRVSANQPAERADSDGTPRGLVQQYFVPCFGGDDEGPWFNTPSVQETSNQTDIWSPDFLRPDTDQWPDSQDDPQIQDRQGDNGGSNRTMPLMPTPLYGLAAVALETGVTTPAPAYPNGPYHYLFIFGGVDANGSIHKEMRWWDVTQGLQAGQGQGQTQSGVFSSVVDMPIERAYAKAIVVPRGNEAPAVALVGGYDHTGAPINQIDVFTFSNPLAPNTGSWSTFNGTLPDALVGCGGGYNAGGEASGEHWVLAFGGWTGSDYSTRTFNARLNSAGLVLPEVLKVAPRRNMGSSQSGAPILPLDFNRYTLLGGVTENGPSSIVEVVSLP
jgi:PKD repeat protein